MPIYEYYCDDCNKSYEVTQRITDKRLEQCPVCNSSRIHKLVSLSSFHLKGTGWYATDYAKKDSKNGNGVNGGNKKANPTDNNAKDKDSGSGDSSKSEAKPNSESKSSEKSESKSKSEVTASSASNSST